MKCKLCNASIAEDTKQDKLPSCEVCQHIIDLVKTHPDKVKEIWQSEMDEPILIRQKSTTMDYEADLPEVLDGKRYRAIDRERNKWYLSVSEIDGSPVEIFASTAFDRDHQLQSRISNLTTITRLISLILRHIFIGEKLTLDKCLKQIQRSSRQKNDLPDMLYNVLSKYKFNETN